MKWLRVPGVVIAMLVFGCYGNRTTGDTQSEPRSGPAIAAETGNRERARLCPEEVSAMVHDLLWCECPAPPEGIRAPDYTMFVTGERDRQDVGVFLGHQQDGGYLVSFVRSVEIPFRSQIAGLQYAHPDWPKKTIASNIDRFERCFRVEATDPLAQLADSFISQALTLPPPFVSADIRDGHTYNIEVRAGGSEVRVSGWIMEKDPVPPEVFVMDLFHLASQRAEATTPATSIH